MEEKFMDIAAGFPSSLHDVRVLRNSSIYDRAEHGDVLAAQIHVIHGHEIQPYLVGEIVLTRFCVSFKNPTLKEREIQVRFNLTSSCLPQELRWSAHSE